MTESQTILKLLELSAKRCMHSYKEKHVFPICACAIFYVAYNIASSLHALARFHFVLARCYHHAVTLCKWPYSDTILTCMYADCKRSNFIVGNPRVILIDSLADPNPWFAIALRILYECFNTVHCAHHKTLVI